MRQYLSPAGKDPSTRVEPRRVDINYFRAFREYLTEYETINFDNLVPNTEITSFKELMQGLKSAVDLLNNSSTPWNTRLSSIVWIQSCLISPDILRMS